MLALQYQRPSKLQLLNLPEKEPDKNEVKIKIFFAGICGTDLHIISEQAPASPLVVLGHEFSGQVLAIGRNVSHVKIGDMVSINPNNFCRICKNCRKGLVQFCENLNPIGIKRNGGWAEYCTVDSEQVFLLPPSIEIPWGALCEPFSCIVHGWDQLQPISPESNILIIGAGIIGLLWGLLLNNYGCHQVIISEPKEERRKIAKNLNFAPSKPQDIRTKLSKSNSGYDIIIDCSGNSQAINQAFNWINPSGKFLFFGVCPLESKINIRPFQIFKKELTLIGSIINPFTFSRSIELIKQIQLPIEKLGVKFYSLQDYKLAINEVKSGKVLKGLYRLE